MLIPVTLLLCLGTVSARICQTDQFFSSFLGECKNCSTCVQPDIVLRPCQGHKDTTCGPMSELHIDWSWMKHGHHDHQNAQKEMTQTFIENQEEIRLHEMHVKEKEKILRKLGLNKLQSSPESSESDEHFLSSATKNELWNELKELSRGKEHGHKFNEIRYKKHKLISKDPAIFEIPYDPEPLNTLHFNSEEASRLLKSAAKEDRDDEAFNGNHLRLNDKNIVEKNFGFFPGSDDMYDLDDVEEKPMKDFSMTEQIVIDWQTGILVMAVTACLVFFLVALCYTLSYLRNWKSVQGYFSKDVEELKSWLKPTKSNLPTSGIYKTTTEVVSKEEGRGHCKYLERIISKNSKRKFNRVPGNVYQGSHPCSAETHPLTQGSDPLIHKNLQV